HTLVFETGDILTLTKEHWRDTQVGRLHRAMEDSRKPRIVFVAMDQDEASIAVLRQFGMKELAVVRSGRSGKQYVEKDAGLDYHGEIAAKLQSVIEPGTPLVVLGPGFAKEALIEDGKQRFPEVFSQAASYHTGQSGMAGIHEMMKKGLGAEVLRDSRVALEVSLMETVLERLGKDGLVTYGPQEVESAAKVGAVETLLVLDSLIRERDLDSLVRNVESQGGEVVVVSEQHDAGRELESLSGVAALLRYHV
ncbi:MAG: mRNA surveillance protein pelota, partial [Candidatus Methanomethylophilaceae archaeon]